MDYNVMFNVGKCKYSINYYDGIQTQISDKEKGENAYKPQILVDEFIKYDKYINYDILIEEEI